MITSNVFSFFLGEENFQEKMIEKNGINLPKGWK
jgi:hypothetical protein